MKPAAFTYHAPTTIEVALELLARYGDAAKVLAGGQSLVPMMNLRMARPEHLIDIGRLDSLAGIRDHGNHIEIGARTRHVDIEESALLRERMPILPLVAHSIAHYAIRTQGTLGGSLAHADPAAQWPLLAVALGATLQVLGARGSREFGAKEFLVGTMTTALSADELLIGTRWPALGAHTGWGFEIFSRRRGDFALCAVVVLVERQGERLTRLNVTVGGVTPTPADLSAGLHELIDAPIDAKLAMRAGTLASTMLHPDDDAKAAGWYRAELIEALVQRAIEQALGPLLATP